MALAFERAAHTGQHGRQAGQSILGRSSSSTASRARRRSFYKSSARAMLDPMIRRLYVDNFRCLVNFEFKPDRVS